MRRPLPPVLRVLVPGLALLAVSPAAADEFQMRDGKTLQVQVLRDLGDRWDVRTLEGRRTIPKSDVRKRIELPGSTPWEIFERKFYDFVDKDDAGENYDLGAWAREQGLEAEARRAFERALRADPEHERSRLALGHTKVDGHWVVPANQRRLPEDRGEPVGDAAPGALEALLRTSLARRRSEHFRLESTHLDQRALGRFLDTLERAREEALGVLGEAPPPAVHRTVYLLVRNEAEYLSVVDRLIAPAVEASDDPARTAQLALYRRGHLAVLPGTPRTCVAWPVDDVEMADRAFLAHFAVHETWNQEGGDGASAPAWVQEAFVYTALGGLFPDDPTWCVQARGYARADRPTLAWRNTRAWPAMARAMAAGDRALTLEELTRLDLNSMTFDHLVQAWSLLDALMAKDATAARLFLRRVRQGEGARSVLAAIFKLDPAGVDRMWRAHVLKR